MGGLGGIHLFSENMLPEKEYEEAIKSYSK